MKIGTVATTGTNYFEVEKSLGGIAISGTIVKADLITAKGALDAQQLAEDVLDYIFSTVKIEVILKPKTGKASYLIERMLLTSVLEYVAQKEGGLNFKLAANGTDLEYSIYLSFTDLGQLPLKDNEMISIEFTDYPDFAFDISAMPFAQQAHQIRNFSALSLGTGVHNKPFDVSEYEEIMLPLALFTTTATIQLNYTNGESPIYSKAELQAIANATNDIMVNVCGHVEGGSMNHAILDCSNIKTIEIRRSEDTAYDLIVINHDIHQNVHEATVINNQLQNISEEKKVMRYQAKSRIVRRG